ncbi:MAG: T9SS type A sorting domain-containing protein [Bacteroidota bacterium]
MYTIRLFIFALLLSVGQSLSAQAYGLINPSREAYFSSSWGGETNLSHAVRIDSGYIQSGLIFNLNYAILDSLPFGSNCEFGRQEYGWFGEKVFFSMDGVNMMLNRNQDSIWIHTRANVGDQFTFMQLSGGNEIEAEVAAVNAGSVLGQSDSIKVFVLQAVDGMGQPVVHPLNQREIHISRLYGLVQGFPFYDLPADTMSLRLAGISDPDLGRRNIGIPEIYDFQVGDTFQYDAVNFFFFSHTDTTYDEHVIKSRYESTNGDTLRYEIQRRRWRRSVSYYSYSDVTSATAQTYTEEYVRGQGEWPLTASMPKEAQLGLVQNMQPVPALPDDTPTLFYSPKYNGRTQSRRHHAWQKSPSSCMMELNVVNSSPISTYAAGLGFVYNAYQDGAGINTFDTLRYYRKGAETWGTPRDFDVLVQRTTAQNAAPPALSIFPNPAHDQLFLRPQGDLKTATGTFSLLDLSGNRLLTQAFSGTQPEIALPTVPPGLYLYRITLKNQAPMHGKLLLE